MQGQPVPTSVLVGTHGLCFVTNVAREARAGKRSEGPAEETS